MLHSAGLSQRMQAPQHAPRVMPIKRAAASSGEIAAESSGQLGTDESGKKSRMTRRDGSTPFSFSSRAFSRPKPSDAQEELSDESDESDSEADDEENDEHEEQELSENDDDDDLEDEASSSESDDSSDGRDTGARFPSMTRRPHTAAGGILARCTRLPSPVTIPANSIGLTYLHGFLSAAECAELISSARPSSFYRSVIGYTEDIISTSRTSYSVNMYHHSAPSAPDSLVRRLLQRVSELTGVPASHVDAMELVRYEPGQLFQQHCDDYAFDKHARRWSVLTYLNDIDIGGGGETEFTKLGVKFAPRQGDALWWQNCPAPFRLGEYHRSSQHQGLPPTKGVKYGQAAQRELAR